MRAPAAVVTQERWGTGLAVESSLLAELRSTFVLEARDYLETLERERHHVLKALHAAHALQGAAAVCDYHEIRTAAAALEARLAQAREAGTSTEQQLAEVARCVHYLKRAVEARSAGTALPLEPGLTSAAEEP